MNLKASTELYRALADATRLRLLALLADEELTVAELVDVTRLPQPRVSTHLAKLKAAQLVTDRRVGPSAFYSVDEEVLPDGTRAWLELLSNGTHDPVLDEDRARLALVKARRSQGWPESVAGHMHRHYSPGRTWEALVYGLFGLIDGSGGIDLVDIGSGDGFLAALLASRVRTVTCVDVSPAVAGAARQRLAQDANASVEVGDMHALPFAPGSFSAALLLSSLEYAEEPRRVLAEVARVLRPGGMLVATTLHAHPHKEAVQPYGHKQLGFEEGALHGLLCDAGFEVSLCEVTSREQKRPHFEVVTVHARKA